MNSTQEQGSITRDFIVYLAILIIAGLQFVIAYQHIDGEQMFARMLALAMLEAGLGVLFFMHLWMESRAFLIFVAVFTLFVLAAMNYLWPDSFRILVGAPFSRYH
ncbi:MAG: cytochrome C oxidase subunit IV family protein [Terriglobales bacterium]